MNQKNWSFTSLGKFYNSVPKIFGKQSTSDLTQTPIRSPNGKPESVRRCTVTMVTVTDAIQCINLYRKGPFWSAVDLSHYSFEHAF